MKSTTSTRFATIILGQMALLGTGYAQTTWDAGGGADTNINTAANWNNDLVAALNGSSNVTFGTGGSTATMNVDAFFTTVTFNRAAAFTVDGPNNFIVRSSNSGATKDFTVAAALGGNLTINAPLRIDTNNADANKLFVLQNGAARTLAFNGNVARSATSSANFSLRYEGVVGSTTRFNSSVTNIAAVQPASGTWAGDLVFAGAQSSGAAITINSGAGYGNPATTARLILGETVSDNQTWGSITLNNVMKVAVGGNVTAGSLAAGASASAANTRIVGYTSTNSTLSLTGGATGTVMTLGGSGANENNLNLIKASSSNLTISGAHTYAGSTTVNGGTLVLNSGATLGTSGITVNSGGALNNASANITSAVTVNAGGTLSGEGKSGALSFGNGTSTFNFDIATPGAFTAASYSPNSGALVLLTPTANTTIGNTYLVLASTAGFGSTLPSEFAASGRGTLALAGGNTQINFTPTAAASLVWKGNVSGNWDVVNSQNWANGGSADRFYSSDSVTFDDTASTGTVAVSGSTVSVGGLSFANDSQSYALTGLGITSAGAIAKSGAGNVTIANTVTAAGVNVTGGSLALNAAVNLGASDLTVGNGTLTLGAANTATGNITLNSGGTLNANNGTNHTTGSLGSFASARTVTLNGGALNYNGSGTVSADNLNLSVAGSSSIGVGNSSVTFRIGGTLSGSGDLAIAGPGMLALGKNAVDGAWGSGYSGNITVGSGAVLSLRNEQSLGNTTGTTTVQSGGTIMMDPFGQTAVSFAAESITFQGNSTLSNRYNGQASLSNTLTGTVTTSGTLGVNTLSSSANSATLTFAGAINGSGGVTFGAPISFTGLNGSSVATVPGTYVLNASNTYAGPTRILSGTVRLGGNERISDSSTLVMAGGTLDLNGFSETFGGLDLDANATIALGASNKISFGSSALLDWGAYTLNFTSVGGSLAADAVRFGTSASALTVAQLSLITVDGVGGYGLDSNGFLAAIPEPSAFGALAGFGVLGLVATRRRRRAV